MSAPSSFDALLAQLDAANRELAVYKRIFKEHTMECISCSLYGEVRSDCPQCDGFNIESAVPLFTTNEKLSQRLEKANTKCQRQLQDALKLLKLQAEVIKTLDLEFAAYLDLAGQGFIGGIWEKRLVEAQAAADEARAALKLARDKVLHPFEGVFNA